MGDSIFIAEGDSYRPTEHARGPWDPQALHGGAPAALITSAFERVEPGAELPIGRLGFEFLRPIPLAPLKLSTSIVRPGRRVQELAAELHAGDELIARASALRMQEVPAAVAAAAVAQEPGESITTERLSGPESAKPVRFALNDSSDASFGATAMEMRWLSDPAELGSGQVWMRVRHPLLAGEPLTPLARLAATADFGNGIGAALPFDRFLFINADLAIHLWRLPRGEWIGIDARTILHEGGVGQAEAMLHDQYGPLGRSFQTLVVHER